MGLVAWHHVLYVAHLMLIAVFDYTPVARSAASLLFHCIGLCRACIILTRHAHYLLMFAYRLFCGTRGRGWLSCQSSFHLAYSPKAGQSKLFCGECVSVVPYVCEPPVLLPCVACSKKDRGFPYRIPVFCALKGFVVNFDEDRVRTSWAEYLACPAAWPCLISYVARVCCDSRGHPLLIHDHVYQRCCCQHFTACSIVGGTGVCVNYCVTW